MSQAKQIADDIKALIEAGSYSVTASVEVTYGIRKSLEDFAPGGDVLVLVSPRSSTSSRDGRHVIFYDHEIDVVVARRVDDEDQLSQIDALINFAEELHTRMAMQQLPSDTASYVDLQAGEAQAVFSDELMDSDKLYMAVLTVTYRATR